MNLLVALNCKFNHTNLAVRYLHHVLLQANIPADIAEHTINEPLLEIVEDIVGRNPQRVLFSCYLWNVGMVERLSQCIKELLPHVQILLGGPEVSHKTFALPNWADGVIQGEGEMVLPQLLGDGFTAGTVFSSQTFLDMDSLPFPYADLYALQNRTLYYESSRGCPFSCAYCLSGQTQDKPRFRSLPLVFADLQRFLDAEVRQVKFVDRTFNANPKRAEAIWQFLLERDRGITNFQFEIGADLLTESQTNLLNKAPAGLFQLEIGVQSVCAETLERVCRKTDLVKLEENVRKILAKENVHCHLDLIAGLPQETFENTLAGCNALLGWGAHQLQLGFLKVLAGAPLGERAPALGLVFDPQPPYEILQTPHISFSELRRLAGLAEGAEVYWNSGRFYESIRFVLGQERPATILLQLWESLPDRPVGKYEYFDFLFHFAQSMGWDAQRLDILKQKMRWDLCRHERPKKLPSCVPSGEIPQKKDLPANLPKDVHTEWVQLPEGKRLVCFDYGKRDILGRASIQLLEKQQGD